MRDEAARLRDVDAVARDRATEAADHLAMRQEAALEDGATPQAVIVALKRSAATLRAAAISDRAVHGQRSRQGDGRPPPGGRRSARRSAATFATRTSTS